MAAKAIVEGRQWKIPRKQAAAKRDRECHLPTRPRLGPQQATRRNGQHHQLGIPQPVIRNQQSESRHGRQRKPGLARQKSASAASRSPTPAKGPAEQVAGEVIKARVIAENADRRLEIDNRIDGMILDTALGPGSLMPPCAEIVARLAFQSCIQCGATCEIHRLAARPMTAVIERSATPACDTLRPLKQNKARPALRHAASPRG